MQNTSELLALETTWSIFLKLGLDLVPVRMPRFESRCWLANAKSSGFYPIKTNAQSRSLGLAPCLTGEDQARLYLFKPQLTP